jgi:hypothetical protein
MTPSTAAALCTSGVVVVLAISWCLLDFWNHQLSTDLFHIGDLRMLHLSQSKPQVMSPFKDFSYPLTLAFIQFAFMGIVFLGIHWAVTQEHPAQLRTLKFSSDKRWPSLVASHVFSVFWLQSLMMPTQVITSMGFFAASRAVEIPVVGVLRGPVLGGRVGKKTLQTSALAFVSACTLYYAYAELAGCVCILSGNGVALTGVAFWIIYGLMLAMPAVNAVCQEAFMVEPGLHPLLILALQNIFASLMFTPILIFSYIIGWEDVGAAFAMILSHKEVFMLVAWLCAQMALTSVVCVMIIQVVDSFWAIALRALRVVFWAMVSIPPGLALSITNPRMSFWAFVICCGTGMAAAAIYTDRKAEDSAPVDKNSDEKALMTSTMACA